jgi:hypothetical protein
VALAAARESVFEPARGSVFEPAGARR